MPDTQKVAQELVQRIDDKQYSTVSGELSSLFQKSSISEFNQVIQAMTAITGKTSAPDVYSSTDSSGKLNVYIDDSWYKDTKIFSQKDAPAKAVKNDLYSQFRIDNKPLENDEHEKVAQDVAAMLRKCGGNSDGTSGGDIFWAKRAAEVLRDKALQLSNDEQFKLLTRAQNLNDLNRGDNGWLPSLNIVFGDVDKDGKRQELTDMRLNFRHRNFDERQYGPGYSGYGESIESIDLYDR